MSNLLKVAVLTSGGDSPGMNAVLYSFAAAAKMLSIEVFFVEDGYKGLIASKFKKIPLFELQQSIFNPGSIIGSARCLDFKNSSEVREAAANNLKKNGIDHLVVVGGNGSFYGAELISNLGINTIAIPGTIDNDVGSTCYTVGFFSALEEIFHAIRKIRATSNSHNQITILEVMGRDCSDLTVYGGLSAAADLVVTNNNPKTCQELVDSIREMKLLGRKGIVVVVSEKIYGSDFGFNLPNLKEIAQQIEIQIGEQTRVNVLGYLQRGAYPTAWENYVAFGFGKYAAEQIKEKNCNISVGYDGVNYYYTSLNEANIVEKQADSQIINFSNKLYKLIKNNT